MLHPGNCKYCEDFKTRFVVDISSGSLKTAWAGLLIAVECHNSIQLHYQSIVSRGELLTMNSLGNGKAANGRGESAVKTAKLLLRKVCEAGANPCLAILDFRNTPTQGIGSSQSQHLMSRRTKTLLPATNQLLQLQPQVCKSRVKLIVHQNKQKCAQPSE